MQMWLRLGSLHQIHKYGSRLRFATAPKIGLKKDGGVLACVRELTVLLVVLSVLLMSLLSLSCTAASRPSASGMCVVLCSSEAESDESC